MDKNTSKDNQVNIDPKTIPCPCCQGCYCQYCALRCPHCGKPLCYYYFDYAPLPYDSIGITEYC